jgi:hypothetical protein
VSRLADDLDVLLDGQQRGDAEAQQLLIIDDEDRGHTRRADGHAASRA